MFLPYGGVRPLWVARARRAEAEREREIAQLRKRTAGWGNQTVAYIFRRDVDPIEPGERLGEVVSAWSMFRDIAGFGTPLRKSGRVPITAPVTVGARLVSHWGVLTLEIAPILRLLDGIEADRIRLCPICDKLFWAGRRDKTTCSQRCAGTWRQRTLRGARAANRAYKKKVQNLRREKER
jgi:hypothetical protein